MRCRAWTRLLWLVVTTILSACLLPKSVARYFGIYGKLFSLKCCCRASTLLVHLLSLFFFDFLGTMVVIQIEVDKAVAVTRWVRSSGANLSWSFFSATNYWELKSLAMIAGKISTSNGRPFWSSGVEGLLRLETSGSVPVSSHGCNELISELLRGEEK
jgi:hypothetical protein